MNYKIVKKEEMHIIGFKKWFSTENDGQMTEIPKSLKVSIYKKGTEYLRFLTCYLSTFKML